MLLYCLRNSCPITKDNSTTGLALLYYLGLMSYSKEARLADGILSIYYIAAIVDYLLEES